MNHNKDLWNTTTESSDDSMLTCDENEDNESDSDYSVSSEILLPRSNKRNEHFNTAQELDIKSDRHTNKESGLSDFKQVDSDNEEKSAYDLLSLPNHFADHVNITTSVASDLDNHITISTRSSLKIPDTSVKHSYLLNEKTGDSTIQSDDLSSSDLKNVLMEKLKDFDNWLQHTYLPQVETLKENPGYYHQCWNRLNKLKGKLNAICKTHEKQKHSTAVKKKEVKKEHVSSSVVDIEKNDSCKQTLIEMLCEKVPFISNKNSDKTCDLSLKSVTITPKIYYPPAIAEEIKKAEGEVSFKTIQFLVDSTYRCLLCKVMISGKNNVLLHAGGKGHKDNLKNEKSVELLKSFHSVWSQFSNETQLHQIYFSPAKNKFVHCSLCDAIVYPQNLTEHIAGRMHSEKLNSQGGPMWQIKPLLRSNSVSSVSSTATQNSKKRCRTKPSKMVNKKTENNPSVNSTQKNVKKVIESNSNEQIGTISKLVKNKMKHVDKIDNGYKHSITLSDTHKINNQINEIWNNIPERLYFNKKNIKLDQNNLLCEVCNVTLKSSVDLLNHLTSKFHEDSIQKIGLKGHNNEFSYFCTLCTQTYSNENKWQSHLSETNHVEKCKLTKNNSKFKIVLKEQMCKECKNVVLFGDGHATLLHHHIPVKKNKEYKIPASIQKLYSSISELESHSEKLLHVAESVLLQDSKDLECCRALAESLKKEFPGCVAYPFGSRVSGLGNEFSDLDIFLDTGNMYNGLRNQDPKIQANLVRITFRALWKNFQWDGLEPIPLARTPIIRAYHKPSDLDCDISFKHGLSVENTKLLSLYMNMQPITRKLILSLKHWSQECQFHFRISSYAISLLAIFYLQTKNYLQTVYSLRILYKGPIKHIAGWDCTFLDDIGKIEIEPCLLSLPELMQDFFKFYSTYKFETMVVCPLLGKSVLKEDFHNDNRKNLPTEMWQYDEKLMQDEPDCEVFRSLSPMCIQDPFDLSHNITKACTQNVVAKFQSACNICYKLLEQQTAKLQNKN